jgi:predicted ribosomally synthesized peptide with SipW-like signal peptide
MKRILFLSLICVLALGLVGGAFAYFSDVETSEGNTFQAGTVDLALSHGEGYENPYTSVGKIASAVNMAPGVEVGPYDVYFKNVGNIDGKVRVNISFTENDATGFGEFASGVNVNANNYARKTIVTQAYLDTDPENKVPYWADQIIDFYGDAATAVSAGGIVSDGGSGYLPTIFGLSKVTLGFYDGAEVVWAPNDAHYENFYLELDASADSDYIFDGIDVTLTATMVQSNAP